MNAHECVEYVCGGILEKGGAERTWSHENLAEGRPHGFEKVAILARVRDLEALHHLIGNPDLVRNAYGKEISGFKRIRVRETVRDVSATRDYWRLRPFRSLVSGEANSVAYCWIS